MAHLHLPTERETTRLESRCESASDTSSDSCDPDDLWISDLTNDLSCFGLCALEPSERERGDELGLLSLTGDAVETPGLLARSCHPGFGL